MREYQYSLEIQEELVTSWLGSIYSYSTRTAWVCASVRECSLEIQEELVTSWLGKQLFLQYWYSLGLPLCERVFSGDPGRAGHLMAR